GRADQEAQIGRIDRRGFDPDHDFVVGRFGRRDIYQRQFEFAALLEQRTQLQPALAITHPASSQKRSGLSPQMRACRPHYRSMLAIWPGKAMKSSQTGI